MRRAAIEMEKIVAWAIGLLVLLVVLLFIIAQLAPGSEDGLMRRTIDGILGLGKG